MVSRGLFNFIIVTLIIREIKLLPKCAVQIEIFNMNKILSLLLTEIN